MEAEGVSVHCGFHVGQDLSAKELENKHDAVLLAIGSEQPFDFFAKSPGRDLDGLHYAMDFLPQQNRRVSGEPQKPKTKEISAKDKHVIVIGGGDTGSDCIGTSNRQGATSIVQFELLPQPPEHENKPLTWPNWPIKLRTSSSQEEGCQRDWAVATKRFEGRDGRVERLVATRVDWKRDAGGAMTMTEVPGTEFALDADLVLFAMGFTGPRAGVLDAFGVARDARSNARASVDDYRTNVDGVFAAGDMRRGQSLVVWAIREGRQCARAVDEYLMGASELPR
jgi:glutamate synthase (NADPH/NADH) small chain